jgi:hypothetical protein
MWPFRATRSKRDALANSVCLRQQLKALLITTLAAHLCRDGVGQLRQSVDEQVKPLFGKKSATDY